MSDAAAQAEGSEGRSPDLPYQMEVYFERYPEVNLEGLSRFVDACEPGAQEACEAHPAGDDQENQEGLRVGGFVISQGGLMIAALVHSVPSPASDMIRHCNLAEDVKGQLLAHGSF